MGDFHVDPYEKFRVEKIEGFREKDQLQPSPIDKKSEILSAALCTFLLTIIKKLSKKTVVQSIEEIKKDINKFKLALEKLEKEDFSQNIGYLKSLSASWISFTKKAKFFLKKKDPFSIKIQQFLKEIHSYPEGMEFSLGYYLSEYAGLNWIPFPFMEILKGLHEQHKKNPKNSLLKKWIEELESF